VRRGQEHEDDVARNVPPFPDDVISTMLRRLVRSGGLLEPHDHAAVHASLSEILALRELVERPGMAQNELAERLGLEKSTVSRLVAGMEQRGWVRRDRDPENRRYVRVALTPDGDEIAHALGTRLHEHHRILLSGLTASELDALTVGLTALARVIEHVHGAIDVPVAIPPPSTPTAGLPVASPAPAGLEEAAGEELQQEHHPGGAVQRERHANP
jgi:DNA-binding MarR family transcriptional regulator